MAEPPRLAVSLFCEDRAHEQCARALVRRCAVEARIAADVSTATAECGIPRLKSELRGFQAVVRRGVARTPDLLVILIDANRVGVAARRREIEDALDAAVFPATVVGVSDPYVERWFLADPVSFAQRFGTQPTYDKLQGRPAWKRRLVDALESCSEVVMQGGAEFAPEIFGAMDLYRAGRSVPSLGTFIDDLGADLRRLTLGARPTDR